MKNKSVLRMCCMIFLMMLVLTACGSTGLFKCPYEISEACVKLGEFENEHALAGMHFSFLNDFGKDIESFTVSFMIYDSEGKNPFACSNCIVARCERFVQSGEEIDVVIDLDSYVSGVAEESYIVDFVFVREICYSDGSRWRDPYGMFGASEESD